MIDEKKVQTITSLVDIFMTLRKTIEEFEIDNIIDTAVTQAKLQNSQLDVNDEELAAIKRNITYKYQIHTTEGVSILSNYDQEDWYEERKKEINPIYWERYRNYLIAIKGFAPNVVTDLGSETLDQKLMNYILDPKAEYDGAVIQRGLAIGDVQSGKTSTYIGFLCKAADAGYKVFILLTGTIESLRKQTQQRVEEGFIGIDMTTREHVGVGKTCSEITVTSVTTRQSDFTGNKDQTVISLCGQNATVFVLKKNKSTLTKLIGWLKTLNADQNGKINLPMLMIDDEADNASINTSKNKEDPTSINKLVRELANLFTVSNYVGFTATPFANVFIDPETTEKMENQDLFPENFIISLPTPTNYIGPESIFSPTGKYHSQLRYITDAGVEEDDGFSFYFKHKKDWRGVLPKSLTDAIYSFYLANALRDLRNDKHSHRSMLVNISRFIDVQKHIKVEIEEIHKEAYNNMSLFAGVDSEKCKSNPIIKRIYENYKNNYSDTEFSWDDVWSVLFEANKNIQIKVVNSSRGSEKLTYEKNESVRVIAIGGLALSRGLTLEGLIISYFYRNTCTYDVLMQMGRWFGYRTNYEDLFRIWTHKASAEWYAEIAEATQQLKDDMNLMREYGKRPRDFGIRVRDDSMELRITAANKMRNAVDEVEYINYFGDIFETPYVQYDYKVHKHNFEAVQVFVQNLIDLGYTLERQKLLKGTGRYILQDVKKQNIIELLKKLNISKYNNKFNTGDIVEFLCNCDLQKLDLFDVAFIEGTGEDFAFSGINLKKVVRNTCKIEKSCDRVSLGQRGKLAGTADGKAGICDYNGKTYDYIVNDAQQRYAKAYKENKNKNFTSGNYPSDTWFKYIEDRKPLLLIFFMQIAVDKDASNQKAQINKLNNNLGDTPITAFAIGFPNDPNNNEVRKFTYKANKIYNYFDRDEILAEYDEE